MYHLCGSTEFKFIFHFSIKLTQENIVTNGGSIPELFLILHDFSINLSKRVESEDNNLQIIRLAQILFKMNDKEGSQKILKLSHR